MKKNPKKNGGGGQSPSAELYISTQVYGAIGEWEGEGLKKKIKVKKYIWGQSIPQ